MSFDTALFAALHEAITLHRAEARRKQMTARVYQLTEREALLAFRQVENHCKAIKNWLVATVEAHDFDRACELALELREHEKLFAKLNVEAHQLIDAAAADVTAVSERFMTAKGERHARIEGPDYLIVSTQRCSQRCTKQSRFTQ